MAWMLHSHSHTKQASEDATPFEEATLGPPTNLLYLPTVDEGYLKPSIETQTETGTPMPIQSQAQAQAQSQASKKSSQPVSKQENLNIKAAFIHVIGDMIQSIGVLLTAIVICIRPDYKIADPICTFIFSILVLASTFKLLKEAIHVLMEGTPSHVDPSAVQDDLLQVKGVVRVHDLHIWCLSSSKTTITVHVVAQFEPQTEATNLRKTKEADACSSANSKSAIGNCSSPGPLFLLEDYCTLLAACQSIICEKYGIHHSTIQIECEKDVNRSHCYPSMCKASTKETTNRIETETAVLN